MNAWPKRPVDAGNIECAKRWFHEAAGCFHVGQHFFYLDDGLKNKCLEKIWAIYPKAIELNGGPDRPVRAEIPFRGASIPAYYRLQPEPGLPLVIQVNGLDNLKEIEQHNVGMMFYNAGLNTIAFDGPGTGGDVEIHENDPRLPRVRHRCDRLG